MRRPPDDFVPPRTDMTPAEREAWLCSLPEWRQLIEREIVAGSVYFKSSESKTNGKNGKEA